MDSNGSEKILDPKKIEQEIGDFLAKKFGGQVKVISPVQAAAQTVETDDQPPRSAPRPVAFDLKPEDLIAHLDQYMVGQSAAKRILATKVCTHFNRIRHTREQDGGAPALAGRIKNNVLMVGPTGVGKTYMVKLIAQRLGVPFVKGDATKFSETGYVGGDVEDLVRDLVREADDDLERAQYGIIYIDEIDKIAGSEYHHGADVSRSGVQRALLKPLEETEVDLKVPHDPISMFQELERYRKTGSRDRRTLNTRDILFIVSGAFSDLPRIIRRRLKSQAIGFGASVRHGAGDADLLGQLKTEDLIEYGFESEFVGRLPVRAVFDPLSAADLLAILRNPNNPVILGKRQDFAAYGIAVCFDEELLRWLARRAERENTGARGLISAVEEALLPFETRLPSTTVRQLAVTREAVRDPERTLAQVCDPDRQAQLRERFDRLTAAAQRHLRDHLAASAPALSRRHNLALSPTRMDVIAAFCTRHVTDLNQAIQQIKTYCEQIKRIELAFYKNHDINMVFEEDAIDHITARIVTEELDLNGYYGRLEALFAPGLKLVRERTGRNRFFINRAALFDPESCVAELLRQPPPGEARAALPDRPPV